jgi:dTMP kinase
MFIVLEGIDACGKTTQGKRLAAKLHYNFLHFPDYSSPVGQLIFASLQSKWECTNAAYTPMIFQALQAANRLENVEFIKDCLTFDGGIVVDRYTASGLVYGAADGLDPVYIESMQKSLPQPNVNFLLDIDVETSVARRPNDRDRYETDNKMHDRVQRYRSLWDGRSDSKSLPRWIKINGNQDPDAIHAELCQHVGALRPNLVPYLDT